MPGHSRKIKKLAVIGPNAKIPSISGGGSASLKPFYVVSPLEAIKKLAHEVDIEISYAAGCHASRYLPLIDPYLSRTEPTAGVIHLSFYAADPATGSQPVHCKTVDTSLAFMVRVRDICTLTRLANLDPLVSWTIYRSMSCLASAG